MSSGPQRILVFGGTFDPPHVAHVTLPRLVADALGCRRIIYVPAGVSPFKVDVPPTAHHHRVAMLLLALEDEPMAEICSVELERDGPSYTVDTLEQLAQQHPDAIFHLLIGADQALRFKEWRDWQRILQMAEPVVMLRPPTTEADYERDLVEAYGEREAERWMQRTICVPQVDVSATDIRNHLARGEDVTGGVSPAVVEYARRERLYASERS